MRHRRPALLAAVFVAGLALVSSDLAGAGPPAAREPRGRTVDRPGIEYRIRQARLRAARAARAARRPRPATPPPVRPEPLPAGVGPTDEQLLALRNCEAGGNYQRNSGNGYYGAYQFHPGTWRGLGYDGMPHEAPPEMQDEAARRLIARSGWGQFPGCARRIGAR
jgi:hypothetical protein